MPFTFQLPTYQVETQTSFTLYPSRAEADNHYQKNVENNIPCELYSGNGDLIIFPNLSRNRVSNYST